MYQPDNFVILKILTDTDDKGHFYRVLAGWSGGYLDGDSWRMNSGITTIKDDDTHWEFSGESGSVYRCHKESEVVRMNMGGVLQKILKEHPDHVSVVDVADILDEFTEGGG